MNLAGLVQLVLADGVGPDQERALAAVMLGLVVFAVVFVLVERQRIRRGREAGKDATAHPAGGWGPQTGASTPQTGASSPMVGPVDGPAVSPDPPPPQRYEGPLSAAPPGITPDPVPVDVEPIPSPAPTQDDPSLPASPSSPDEIGIVMPDDGPSHVSQEPPPAG